ncbi:hypothetical protein CBM2608_A10102 [Cupriavidus taiwanensis]|nr:hypothetical protein CBM2608_A10102 [Cupriavidus taiwanensis]
MREYKIVRQISRIERERYEVIHISVV